MPPENADERRAETPAPALRRGAVVWALSLAVVVALAWLAYCPMLGTYFHHDDFNWLRVARQWQTDPGSLAWGDTGVTVVWNLLFFAAYQFGAWHSTAPYFIYLISAHALCSVFVSWLLWQLTADRAAALAAGIAFAVLATHHEAVGWIAAGPHVVMAVLLLLGVNLWLTFMRGATWPRLLGPLAVLATLFTKDSGVVAAPVTAVVHAFSGAGRGWKPLRQALWWFVPPYALLLLWRIVLPPTREAIEAGGADYHLGWHALSNLATCVPQMLIPDLAYPNYHAILTRFAGGDLAAALVTASHAGIGALFVASVIAVLMGNRLVKLSVLWCYVAFLPFAPFSYDYARAPRYQYAGSVGLALLLGMGVAWVLRRLHEHRGARIGVYALLLALVAANLLPLRLLAVHRMRDSDLRRAALEYVLERVPTPADGDSIHLIGLPEHLEDLQLAVPVIYPVEVTARLGPPQTRGARVHVVDLSRIVAAPGET